MPIHGLSLDPGRPLVTCQWSDPGGEGHGHGITLGTLSEPEISGLMADRRDRRQTAAHERGSHDEKRSGLCPVCT